jgi:hypothetical protein
MICGMEEVPHGSVRDLVSNLDRMGISEWEDGKPRMVAVPATTSSQAMYHGVRWNLKHVTRVTCVATSENTLFHTALYRRTRTMSDQDWGRRTFHSGDIGF